MLGKSLDDTKKGIRSVLLTYPGAVTLHEFSNSYKGLLGERLPSKYFGFSSDVEFLQSMPDVVTVNTDVQGKVHLRGIADEKSEHIQKLVSKQRKPNGRLKNKTNKQPAFRLRGTFCNGKVPNTLQNVKEQKPFLPVNLKAEILQVMSRNRFGLTFTAFALAYRKKFNKYLPLVRGMDTLESMIKLIPELEVTTEGSEKRICYKNFESDNAYQVEATSSENKREKVNSFDILNSGIPKDVLNNLELIIKKCPEGVLDIHFPPLYEKITGKPFDLHDLGYNSLSELIDALPHIFKRILNPEDNRTWIILPGNSSVKHCSNDQNESGARQKNKSQLHPKEGIPYDAASPSVQYIEPRIPTELDLNNYVPVFLFAIENPSVFWFQIQTDEAIEKFETFEENMRMFYKSFDTSKYRMKDSDIVIGATCVILCPEDKQFYRAVIKSIPSVDFINVLYVDYGSTENISRKNIYYVKNEYLEFPACAFEAKLADVVPAHNESMWSDKAVHRFIDLSKTILMAHLKELDKGIYGVTLCDTNGETDIYLHETLVNEGLAEFCPIDHSTVTPKSSQDITEDNAFGYSFTTDSDGEYSSGSYKCNLPSSSCLNSSPEKLTAKRALSFSPESQYNGITSNITPNDIKQDCRRYIKVVKLCDDTKLHFINFENMLYLSCGNLARLLWNNMDSDCLTERLEDKEVVVPFLKLLREDQIDLFNQCIWHQIPEFEKLKSAHSSLIIYSLERAFNVLNIFGHPSVCLRLAIQNEIQSFDPSDSYWKKFTYPESSDLDEVEKDFQEQISRLCLYDLKAKSQAFKITRLKLSRVQSDNANTELKKIEKFQSIIDRRIQEIEAICSMFSSL